MAVAGPIQSVVRFEFEAEVAMWGQVKQALAQSTARFLTRFATMLPGLAALIFALVVSIIVALILALIVRRLLTSLQFEERLARWGFSGMADWSPMNSPTLLVSRSIALLVILVGFLIGIAAFDAQWTSALAQTVLAYIPNMVGAVLVLLVGGVVARFLGRSVLIGAVNMNLQYARLLSAGVKWLVIVLAVAMALDHLRIAPGIVELAFGILFGGIVLALSLAVGLGSKELVTKSLERDVKRSSSELEDPLRHL
jgi:Mechanosensitive ion channel, conserved TM helix